MTQTFWKATYYYFLKLDTCILKDLTVPFPGGSADKEYAYNEGDLGSIPGLRRSLREGRDNPL